MNGIAVASIAPAMQALRAVKKQKLLQVKFKNLSYFKVFCFELLLPNPCK